MTAYLLVGAGGALGAMARFGLGGLIGTPAGAFPVATFAINIIGSVLMGLLVGTLARLTPEWGATARLFLAVGVLGGFTTFSSFSLEAVSLIEKGEIALAVAYSVGTVILSLSGFGAGLFAIRALS
jgi:CrcB protein